MLSPATAPPSSPTRNLLAFPSIWKILMSVVISTAILSGSSEVFCGGSEGLSTSSSAVDGSLPTCPPDSQSPYRKGGSLQGDSYLTEVGNHDFEDSVTIGFLGSYGRARLVLGALPLAVTRVNEDEKLLPGKELRFLAEDIGTSEEDEVVVDVEELAKEVPEPAGTSGEGDLSTKGVSAAARHRGSEGQDVRRRRSQAAIAIRRMTEMRDIGMVAFIGPDETCMPEALVAAAWNLPMISYKCTDMRVSDKRVFYTFARTLPPSSKVSKSVVALLRTFEWNKFVMVVEKRPSWIQVKDAVSELSQRHGLQITDIYQFSGYIPEKIHKLEYIVSETYQRTRVYVFIGEHIALVDFVNCLQRRRLLDTGEYAIISVDDEIYDPKKKLKIVQRDYLDPFLGDKERSGGGELPSTPSSLGANKLQLTDILGFRSVLKLTPSHPRNPEYGRFCQRIKEFSAQSPFCVPYHRTIFDSLPVPIHAAHLYDAVMIYAQALTEVFQNGDDPRNGSAILERIKNRSYHSIQGYDVYIDENGDAEGNYSVVALLDDDQINGSLRMSMQPVGYFQYSASSENELNKDNESKKPRKRQAGDATFTNGLPTFKYYDENRPIQWIGGKIPKAEPMCGFRGEKCVYRVDWKVTTILPVIVSLLVVASVFAFRHYRYEQKLACLLWKVDMKDVKIFPIETVESASGENKRMFQVFHQSIFQAPGSSILAPSPANYRQEGEARGSCAGGLGGTGARGETSTKRACTLIGSYKGGIVAIKPIHKRHIDLTRAIRKELKQIREVRHENIIPFIGACVDHGSLCILTGYCTRGSLEDVLANDEMHLDNMFVSSLVADLLKGMIYLHDSEIISHGNLRSSNCLIDSRWVLQISDFGLHELKAGQEEPDRVKARRRLLWRAPELLRDPNAPPRGSQKGDVYSLGIVLYEIVGRSGPWGDIPYSVEEILEHVTYPEQFFGQGSESGGSRRMGSFQGGKDGINHPEVSHQKPHVFRPPLECLDAADYVVQCIQSCWDEDPEQRPDLRFVRVKIKEMQAGLKPNIFDNMLAIMEKYAYNLEVRVQEKTMQLSEEKKKTEALLHRMLPKTVAEALKRGDPVEAESFDCVTIYFSDIVGFTELAAISTPLQVVEMLNDLYTCFDSILPCYDVYKVETIGDAYMVASGLPVRNGDRHAGEVASLALHLLSRLQNVPIRHRPTSQQLRLRIGIHSGQCVAGVVGLKMPRYCLFGDTVNTASRMESSGEALKIHISEATFQLLERLGGYYCEERGLIPIKGKGEMRTYWLIDEDPAHRKVHAIYEEIKEKSPHESIKSDGLHEGFASSDETPDLLRHPAGMENNRDQKQNHLSVFSRSSLPMISASFPASPRTTARHSSLKCTSHIQTFHQPTSSSSLPAKGCPLLNQLHQRAVAHSSWMARKVASPEGNASAGYTEKRFPTQFGVLEAGYQATRIKQPRSAPAITFIDTSSSPQIKDDFV